MSVLLDPHEVLSYLNRMGYCNVDTDQLKQFIRDLKKLIKHDLSECKCTNGELNEESPSSSSDMSFYDSSTCMYRIVKSKPTCTSSTNQEDTTDSSSSSKPQENKEPSKQNADTKNITRDKQSNIQKVTDRPRSAFIRHWQLQGPVPSRRCDPVALYHKYQSLWQQQKVPGDDRRIGLRWNVREKMLAVDPQPPPRPMPRASSMEKIARPKQRCSTVHLV